jgi:septum formation protein
MTSTPLMDTDAHQDSRKQAESSATVDIPVVLASASPRRRDLLEKIGLKFIVAPAEVDEDSLPYRTPRELAIKAAFAKALAVAPHYQRAILLAADTVVALDGKVYGKPASPDDARRMLRELSGQRHVVITGIVVKESRGMAVLDAVETWVTLRELSEGEIERYVATGEPMDKAGAYAIQGRANAFVTHVEGDYWNVVGLPVARLLELLGSFLDVRPFQAKLRELRSQIPPLGRVVPHDSPEGP